MDIIIDEKSIGSLFLEVVCKFYENDMKAKKFGTDTELHHSEIHMIKFIKENENLHISAIARKMNVTRGAVSQTIKRLEAKGFIYKEAYGDNNCRFLIRLTKKGEVAYANHKKYHEEYEGKIAEILNSMSENEKEFLHKFLIEFKDKI